MYKKEKVKGYERYEVDTNGVIYGQNGNPSESQDVLVKVKNINYMGQQRIGKRGGLAQVGDLK